ncbi:MAG: peptidoglycan editing factor PgeF [Saprospiraceae bacterium]
MNKTAIMIEPDIFKNIPNLKAGQTTRKGGVSEAPYDSLNLSFNTEDEIENVKENRKRAWEHLGFREEETATAHQTHGTDVKKVDQAGKWEGYDAFITKKKGILLAVSVADCCPILIYDPIKEAVAAIHAGWKGTIHKIVSKTLQTMQSAYQTKPSDCLVYIGTCIDLCDYEVGAEVSDHFPEAFKEWDENRQKYRVDLKSTNRHWLLESGVKPENIEVSPYSTFTNADLFFSHRHSGGKTGRGMAMIGVLKG